MSFSTSPRGPVQAATAMALLGSLPAVSATVNDYPLFGGQAVRYAVAAALLFAIAWIGALTGPQSSPRNGPRPDRRALPRTRRRPGPAELLRLAALAATGLVAFNCCAVAATAHVGPATVGIVLATVPVVLALIGPLQRRRRPSGAILTGALIVSAGATLSLGSQAAGANGSAAGPDGSLATGLLLALGALAGEVCFSLLAVPLLPTLGPVLVSAYSAALAAPMLLTIGLAVDGRSVVRIPSLGEALAFGYLALIVTAVAFLLWYDALGRMGADRAGLFAGLIPVSTVGTAALIGLGAPGPAELVGAVIVGTGVALGIRPRGNLTGNLSGSGPAVTGDAGRAYPGGGSAAPTPGGPQPGRPHARIADV